MDEGLFETIREDLDTLEEHVIHKLSVKHQLEHQLRRFMKTIADLTTQAQGIQTNLEKFIAAGGGSTSDTTALSTALDAIGVATDTITKSTTTNPGTLTAPQNVKVDTSVSGELTYSWDKVDGAASYNVSTSSTQGGPYSVAGGVSALTFTQSGVPTGTQVFAVVNGVGPDSNDGPDSTEVSATSL